MVSRARFSTGVAAAALAVLPSFAGSTDHNILLIVMDDIGVDILEIYDEGAACSGSQQQCFSDQDCPNGQSCDSDYPNTPNIDQLAAEGLLFRNAWASPRCSPARATILTGRYGFRTGALQVAEVDPPTYWLQDQEVTIPEVLDDATLNPQLSYTHAAFGKWHLGSDATAPNDQGYSHFAGALGGALLSYFNWTRTVDGQSAQCSTGSAACPVTPYATSVNVNDALAWIANQTQPWFVWLAFNAPHKPWQIPPHNLVSPETLARLPKNGMGQTQPPGTVCNVDPRPCYLAMMEAMDAEIGRLLTSLPGPTTIILVGDNGTPGTMGGSAGVTIPPFDADRAKGTVYEGGVNVPLIIRDPYGLSAGAETGALVSTTDLFATVLDLAGANLPTGKVLDSVSLVPLMTDPTTDVRPFAYTEILDTRAIRKQRFKLIAAPGHDELYDLEGDPPLAPPDTFEQNDLLLGQCSISSSTACHVDGECPEGELCVVPPLAAPQQAALDDLRATVEALWGAGSMPDGQYVPGELLRARLDTSGQVTLDWGASCSPADEDFAVYEGQLGTFTSHVPVVCSTSGETTYTLTPQFENAYFLIVPRSRPREGGYGCRSNGIPRPPSAAACAPQSVRPCGL